MSEESAQAGESAPVPVRYRKCPACQESLFRFILSAIPLPIEQVFIPWLRGVNQEIGWSVRSFGSTDVNELQFLAFTSICPKCGNISWWDMSTEELEYILNNPASGVSIRWNYEPRKLIEIESKLSEDKKWIVSRLLDNMKIERNGDEPAR